MSDARDSKTFVPDAATIAAYWRLLRRLFGEKEPPPDAPPPPPIEQPEDGGAQDA